MSLLPADFIWIGLTVLLTVLGIVRGFSGAFAFLVAIAVAVAVGFFGWSGFLNELTPTWVKILATVILVIVVFGVVRILVKHIIGKILSQPSDSIFGFFLGVVCSATLLWGVARIPALYDYSALAQRLSALMAAYL